MSKFETALRILVANFIVEILPVLLIAAGIVLLVKARKAGPGAAIRRYLGISLVSLPVGVIAYIISGIVAALIVGSGHFYSVPFGGFHIAEDAPVLASAIFWIACVFLGLAAVFRSRPGTENPKA